ncbi:MAG: hypothetical protein LBB74_05375 [Chitinispirillales bacterium]|jgi:hypothetical protein|nr:hypothetical protein [Chitinispirillales bacterium]
MRKNRIAVYAAAIALFALLAASGCGNPQGKLQSAAGAENSGKYREAAALYAALVLETAPAHRLPEAQKGKVVQPALWQGEIEKYVKWLTEPAAPFGGTLKNALEGLERCAPRAEADNSANTSPAKPIDSLPAFAAQWNTAFNPPPPNTIDWDAVVKNAYGKNFSILRVSAPINYTYEVNIVSRKTSRRIVFTLYPATPDEKSQILAPLPEGEYTVIVKSSVDFQKGQYWNSEYTALPTLTVGAAPSIINMSLKTTVNRK